MAIPFVVVQIGVLIASHLLLKALTPKVRPPKPGELETPEMEEGRAVPVIFGTVQIAPHVVGVWDKKATELSNGSVRYTAYMHMVFCHGPVDAVRDIQFDKLSLRLMVGSFRDFLSSGLSQIVTPTLPWARPTVSGTPALLMQVQAFLSALTIYSRTGAPNLIQQYLGAGARGAEGGIAGPVDFYWGALDDPTLASPLVITPAPLLVERLGPTKAPSYPGLCHAAFGIPQSDSTFPVYGQPKHFQWSKDSPYIRPVSLVLQRMPQHLTLDCQGAFEPSDANPIQVVYEILTDQYYGVRLDPSLIDHESFRYATKLCEDEMMGVSFALTERTPARDVIQDVLRHCRGTLYTSPTTGLLCVWLVRPVPDASVLPLFDESSVEEITVSRTSWRDTVNDVRVTYREYVERLSLPSLVDDGYIGFMPAVVGSQNPAHAMHVGESRVHTVDYSMFSRAVLAKQEADALVVELSGLRWSGSGMFNRTAFALFPGSAIRVCFPTHKVPEMLARVSAIDYGDIENGRIRVDWKEDVAGEIQAFSEPPPSGPVSPPTPPPPPELGPESCLIRPNQFLRSRFTDGVSLSSYYEFQPEVDDAVVRHILMPEISDPLNAAVQTQVRTPNTGGLFVDTDEAPAGAPFTGFTVGRISRTYRFLTEGVDEAGFDFTPLLGFSVPLVGLEVPLPGYPTPLATATENDRNRAGEIILGNRLANLIGWLGGVVRQPSIPDAEDTQGVLEHAECFAFREISPNGDGSYRCRGVVRAILDSTPWTADGTTVPVGTIVRIAWAFGPYAVRKRPSEPTDYAVGDDLEVSLLPVASVAGAARVLRDPYGVPHHLAPYPAARLRVNGFGLTTWPFSFAGDLTVTWSRRHRVDQGVDFLVPQSELDQGASLEGAYRIEVLIDGVVIGSRTVASTTSQSFVYARADRLSDDPDLTKPTRIRITPFNAAIVVTAAYGAAPATGPIEGEPFLTPPIYHTP